MTTEATPEVPKDNGAPKISLADIESEISHVAYMTGDVFLRHAEFRISIDKGAHVETARGLTICLTIMKNGFIIVGKSAPVSPENYDKAQGQKLAYEDCIKKAWPLMGYQLREQLHTSA